MGEFLEQARPSSPTPAQLGHSERALNKQLRDGRAGLDGDHVRNLDAICMRLTARLAVLDKNSHLAGAGHAALGNAVTSKSERYYEVGGQGQTKHLIELDAYVAEALETPACQIDTTINFYNLPSTSLQRGRKRDESIGVAIINHRKRTVLLAELLAYTGERKELSPLPTILNLRPVRLPAPASEEP